MKNRFVKKLLLSVIITLLALLVMEMGIRIADRHNEFLPPGKPDWIKLSPTIHYEMEPNYSGTIYGARVGINSHGFRGPEIKDKSDHEFRIVVLGNSCVFGNEVRYEETICAQLEDLLNNAGSGIYRVFNAGVPGYSSYQGLIMLQEKVIGLNPDLLLVSFGFNDRRTVPDSTWMDGGEFFERDYRAQTRMQNLRKSYLVRFVFWLFKMDEKIPVIEDYVVRVDKFDYKNNIENIIRTAEAAEIPVILFSIPDNPKYLEAYGWASDAMDRDDFPLAQKFIEKNENIYSRMARWQFNKRLRSSDFIVPDIQEYTDLMAFHGGLPIYTSEEYDIFLKAAAKSMDVPIIGYIAELEPADYIDFIHLNKTGSEKIAAKLAEYILSENPEGE